MSLLKLRGRFRAVKSLDSILNALQMVTAVRTQRARAKLFSVQEYIKPLKNVFWDRGQMTATKGKILVIISSNQGLCGSFSKGVVTKALNYLADKKDYRLVVFGRKGVEGVRMFPAMVGKTIFSEYNCVDNCNHLEALKLFRKIYDFNSEIYVAYNVYKSAVTQLPVIKKLHPMADLAPARRAEEYILEPEPERLTSALYYHYIEMEFYRILLESKVGELAARLMVLKGAVDNSRDLIGSLTIAINKARQADITSDLIEIISSAEALRRDYE